MRHVIGQLLPDLMMGCLHQAVPERVTAEGASALWNPPLRGGVAVSGQARGNRPVIADFEIITFNSGGTGARPTQGRAERHRLPLRRAHHAGGGDRERRAGDLLDARNCGRTSAAPAAPAAASARSWRSAPRATWNSR